ncbi:hypothetical protein BT93_A1492 [Corymbia citriodora subsp. variegata]|nr:hypothetical protein BT93_A1492 [Corymbia citriodora subsp. variegata]
MLGGNSQQPQNNLISLSPTGQPGFTDLISYSDVKWKKKRRRQTEREHESNTLSLPPFLLDEVGKWACDFNVVSINSIRITRVAWRFRCGEERPEEEDGFRAEEGEGEAGEGAEGEESAGLGQAGEGEEGEGGSQEAAGGHRGGPEILEAGSAGKGTSFAFSSFRWNEVIGMPVGGRDVWSDRILSSNSNRFVARGVT